MNKPNQKPEPLEPPLYDVLEYIMDYEHEYGRKPTYSVIATYFNLSITAIAKRIDKLKRLGFVKRIGGELFIVKIPKLEKQKPLNERVSQLERGMRGLIDEINNMQSIIDGQRHRIELLDGRLVKMERES